MSAETQLVLLTQAYPYGHAESFIATELDVLAQKFAHVVVVPLTPRGNRKVRPLPAGVEVLNIFPLRAPDLVNALGEIRPAMQLQRHRRVKDRAIEAIWLSKMAMIAARIRSLLPHVAVARTYYGYWLANTAAVAALLARREDNAIAVARAHGGDLYLQRAARGFHPGRRLHAKLDQIYPISNAGYHSLQAQGFPAGQLHIARLGVPETPGSQYQSAHNWRIVSCSNAAPVKRLALIAEAVAILAHQGHPIRWLHIGDTELAEGDLASLMGKHGCDREAFVATGRLPAADVLARIREFQPHVFVNASSTEGVPVSVMEAFSLGIPVIATNAGGTGEIVVDHENGLLLPIDITGNDLARAIQEFAELDPHDVQAYRQGAVATWRQLCSAQQNYQHFSTHLCQLLASKNSV
ncbi:MAG: glycosyltransferase [Bowdeniella nasicola]|nr:glycosyltransferase [Bowdeniella nasicola]